MDNNNELEYENLDNNKNLEDESDLESIANTESSYDEDLNNDLENLEELNNLENLGELNNLENLGELDNLDNVEELDDSLDNFEELDDNLENFEELGNNIFNEIFNNFNNININNDIININIMDNYNILENNNENNNNNNNNNNDNNNIINIYNTNNININNILENNNIEIIDPMIIYGMRLLNNNNENVVNIDEKINQVNEYIEFCNENNMLLYINFDIFTIIHNIFMEFYTIYINSAINNYDQLITNTIKKCYNVLINSGQTIKDSTVYIITYVNYSENYINDDDIRYNDCLFFNYKILVIEDIKRYLLSLLIVEDITNSVNLQFNQNMQNMQDVRCVLNNETLENIPMLSYCEISEEIKNINNYCSVCRDSYNNDDQKKLRILKCNHVFCCECIDPWLLNHSHKCPNCRVEMDGHIYI